MCAASAGQTRYTADGPAPNTSDTRKCAAHRENASTFYPTEMHGVTMQEGPDGNTDAAPTYTYNNVHFVFPQRV